MPTVEQMLESMRWAGEFLTRRDARLARASWRYSRPVCDLALVNQFPLDKTADSHLDAK
ncbi:hypothetical protein ORI20_32035 [Mycobacterium sp. CVI_P3]|uniref:Transposase n=1 Tax=Mycobacterium pinniadriaticum TaxID=2994102 RepID=A0ABT3SPD8_9MYCO|nr:hypothetical protein [Mycobacterium pinniadriaticum]MCX2934896.1 hypothetical protein [Mycobacterium pinniadriaticum]MCX2941318.1 hypothetical protein [Mycobacterium pinniadriaticum]